MQVEENEEQCPDPTPMPLLDKRIGTAMHFLCHVLEFEGLDDAQIVKTRHAALELMRNYFTGEVGVEEPQTPVVPLGQYQMLNSAHQMLCVQADAMSRIINLFKECGFGVDLDQGLVIMPED